MPKQAMVQGANTNLGAASVPRLVQEYPDQVERLSQHGTFVGVARTVLELSDEDAAYLEAIPSALQESMRAAIYDAMANGKSVQMQFSPGYDFSVQLWDYGEAVSIHLSGPYEVAGYSSTPEHWSAKRTSVRRSVGRGAAKRTAVKRKPAKRTAAKRKPVRRKPAGRPRRRGR